MDPCSECGNHSLAPRQYEGATVLECTLCGALSGGGAAIGRVQTSREALAAGVAPQVFGLVQAISALDGLRVRDSGAGDRARGVTPHVHFAVLDARGLVQLENLAKSLQLSARALGVPWCIEVEFQGSLDFVLRPRGASHATETWVGTAQKDLQTLERAIRRDVRLGWWRHPAAPG